MSFRGAFSALALLALSCGPIQICEAPCPGASGQAPLSSGTLCWCGAQVSFFPWVELGEACDAQRGAFAGTVPPAGCPIIPGGHAP